ncbi:MAG: hypothetical protein JWO49_2709 [Arthrobacter sp.]|nr:hypothetical protein [Arthrobacter sp.]
MTSLLTATGADPQGPLTPSYTDWRVLSLPGALRAKDLPLANNY